MHKKDRDILVSTLKMAAALLVLVVGIALLPGDLPYETVREFGPVETISVGLYFLFILFIVYFNATGILRTSFAPGVFILLLALREMDFHARFTTMGMFKIKFYLSPEVPVEQKIIVVLFDIAVISYAIVYLRKVTPGFLRALSARKAYAFSIIFGLACMVASKLIDGNSEVFEFLFGMEEGDLGIYSSIMEECLELFIPVFFIMALIQYGVDYQARLAQNISGRTE
ncbi:hypothetical protein [Desulfopila inferna]|uniref:hypothetical protein n=1 Tax=Desulfopila inferna TaxID=468528 RepID=UPI001963B358|nr:hypothetical protein [Desulfopila inferna]MBM9604851.1 hypothetical protein [Desulfopila inferna]